MSVVDLVAFVDRIAGLRQVKDVISDRWAPPPRVRILARRGHSFRVTEEVMSLSVKWYRLDPEDYVEPS